MRDTKRRNKGGVLALAAVCLCLFFSVSGEAKVRAPKMECHAYAVMDAGSGEILFGQDENKMIYPASTAKLMTAIVCVENGDVNGTIKTKEKIINGTTYGTYCLGLASGVKFTFKDLLNISLISSAADATDSLAAGVFGSKQACVEAMNAKCAQLGLTQTSFDNPVGSDIGAGFNETYSTAAEMAEICRYAMTVPEIRSAVAKSHYDATGGQDISCNTTNWFLRGMAYYDEDKYTIIGSKSGTTNAAGDVFIATAMDDKGHEVICAYFGNVSKDSTFTSIRRLLDYTFEKYEDGKLQLTPSNYDVRGEEDIRLVYDEYAALNCYPSSGDGLFRPEKSVTREEMAELLRGVERLDDSAVLDTFSSGNRKGNVTAARLAALIRELYPEHLTEEEITAALSECSGTERLSEEEKEAFALFQVNGLSPDEFCKNARQVVTRKQALLIADRLSDYQMRYRASHPVFLAEDAEPVLPQEITSMSAVIPSTDAETNTTPLPNASANAATLPDAPANAVTSPDASANAVTSPDAAPEQNLKGEYPALATGSMDLLSGLNKKWLEHLTEQVSANLL